MNIDFNQIYEYLYNNITIDLFIKIVIIYFFIVWFALLLWVIKDIWGRTNSITLQIISIFIILFLTPLWIFLYLIIRPSKTLFEKYYQEIEENLEIFNQIIEEKNEKYENEIYCYNCWWIIKHDFQYCPYCNINLKKKCTSCNKIIHLNWKNCPYCWEEIINKSKNIDNIILKKLDITKKVKEILSKK